MKFCKKQVAEMFVREMVTVIAVAANASPKHKDRIARTVR